MHAKSRQSCPILCDPMDCRPPGSSVQAIIQVRILEWVAMTFSRGSSNSGIESPFLCLLHWQVSYLPLTPPGKPNTSIFKKRKRRKVVRTPVLGIITQSIDSMPRFGTWLSCLPPCDKLIDVRSTNPGKQCPWRGWGWGRYINFPNVLMGQQRGVSCSLL